MSDGITDEAVSLVRDALKFFVWAAGEGMSPHPDDAPEPETTLYQYTVATGDEDWDALPDKIAAALPLLVAAERERCGVITMPPEQYAAFLKMLDDPPLPNAKLKVLFRKGQAAIRADTVTDSCGCVFADLGVPCRQEPSPCPICAIRADTGGGAE